MRYKHILLHVTEALTGAIERLVEGEKGSEQRSHDPVEESHDPVGVSVESCEPVGVLEKSHDPVGVSEESRDPVGVSEKSHDPVGVSEESHDPMGREGVTRRPDFDKVFMISALNGDGVEELKVRGGWSQQSAPVFVIVS